MLLSPRQEESKPSFRTGLTKNLKWTASPHSNNKTVENVGLAWELATNETFSTLHAGELHEEEKTQKTWKRLVENSDGYLCQLLRISNEC